MIEAGAGPTGDMPTAEFRRLARETADWIAEYMDTVQEMPVFPDVRPGELRDALPATAPDEGESMDVVLADFREHVVPGLNHWNHPGFFGYFASRRPGRAS